MRLTGKGLLTALDLLVPMPLQLLQKTIEGRKIKVETALKFLFELSKTHQNFKIKVISSNIEERIFRGANAFILCFKAKG